MPVNVIWLLVFLSPFSSQAAFSTPIESSEQVVELLNSTRWQDRDKAVAYVSSAAIQDDKVQLALIHTLEAENQRAEQWHVDYSSGLKPRGLDEINGEGYGEYYGALIAKVGALKDPRAINALVSAEGGEQIAIKTFGQAAVRPMIDHFSKTKNTFSRSNIIRILGKMTESNQLSADLRKESEQIVFRAAAEDPEPKVREIAIQKLVAFNKDRAVTLLKDIAVTDSYSVINKASAQKTFPVRDAARQELETLKK